LGSVSSIRKRLRWYNCFYCRDLGRGLGSDSFFSQGNLACGNYLCVVMTHLPDQKNENRWPAGGGVDWEHVWPQHRRWLATVLLARGVEAGAVEEVL